MSRLRVNAVGISKQTVTRVMGKTLSSRTSPHTSALVGSKSGIVAPSPVVRMTRRLSDNPRSLWTAFAVAWLLVLALAIWHLPGAHLSPARLGGSAACVALIALV